MPPLLKLLRPAQWTKNGFCLAGVVFSGHFHEPRAIAGAFLVFILFCAASSSVYIFNDLVDAERDAAHPLKFNRPIPSGTVSKRSAVALAAVLTAGVLATAAWFNVYVLACLAAYFGLNLAYTFLLKHLPIVDVHCIALGFVLRLLAGIYGVGALPTAWILLCTLGLALLLAASKRRSELAAIEGDDFRRRSVLRHYTLPLLDEMILTAKNVALLSYALFTVLSGKNPSLVLTVPIVYLALERYLFLVRVRQQGEHPEQILLGDRGIQLCLAAWIILYLMLLSTPARWIH